MPPKKQNTAFPKEIKFKFPWRKYQERVLKELEEHLEDNHLHIVAPPGSGKTVLGLEVMLRLGKPALILAPTIAIRNQWSQRFCELFLQVGKHPQWISRDIKKPALLTVSTYQSLHAAFSGSKTAETDENNSEETTEEYNERRSKKISETEFKKLVRAFKRKKIGTIVVDEAHHLKNEWWNSLSNLKEALEPTIVGLTATPPYDVGGAEWERYIELNGPVDAEITTPELVAEGDLCPHQEYVYLSTPTGEEAEKITGFKQRSTRVFEEIKHDSLLKDALSNHPAWQNPDDNLEWIYTNLEYYSAMLIFQKAAGTEIHKKNIKIYGRKVFKIPRLNRRWMETVLDFFLHREKKYFDGYAELREQTANKLRRNGVLEKKQINFSRSRSVDASLVSSLSKLNSIYEIVELESRSLESKLRMVILTDYIRREYLAGGEENREVLRKIGVVPIFERIRREDASGMKMGVLTGSLVIIPSE